MRRFPLLVAVFVISAVAGAAYYFIRRPPPSPDAGIPLGLAEERAARVSGLAYDVSLTIPVQKSEPVRGKLTASFALSDAERPLAFDFTQPADRLVGVEANGSAIDTAIAQGHIMIPKSGLVKGANTITFTFVAGDEALNRQDDFLYSLFVPARASLTLPCFDQPDLKARWRLTLNVPAEWSAISNGKATGRAATGDRVSVIFDETQPISTYLFAFAAGRFNIELAERNGRTMRMFHRETDEAKVARNRDAVFDQHARAIEWLEDYTGIPYPFGKFDFVLIPSFQFGGMEHPGAIYYNASGVLLDETATQNQLLGRANVIAHETAHMWFGDLVTMRWFNDVWMKEVFANFMAAKIVNPSFPTVNHELRFLLQHYPQAYGVDRTDGANPIRQDLANLNEAGSLYGAIIYQKAPIVMRQLERILGADAFRDGLREYLKAHALGNATWPDLIRILDDRTPVDLAAWSRAWVTEPGRPVITTNLQVAGSAVERLSFKQQDPRGRNLVWPERLQVLAGSPAGTRMFDVALDGAETVVNEAAGMPVPSWILPVGGGLGYGLFELDSATTEYLVTSLHEITDPVTRGAAVVALWESMLEGRVASSRVFQMLAVALPRETNELNLQQMLDYGQTVFWRFTPADDRAAAAALFEPVIRTGLDRATTMSTRAAWFNALRSVAITEDSIAWLERVWRREVKVPGLPLAEMDEIDLALDLAVRDVANAETILREQHDRIKSPDRKARFAFVTPALSRDPAVRERFFLSLKDVNNRRREAWVLEGVRYLHHPLRAASSKKFVRPALELVREIQQTGDIFFPKRWADATLGGYQSVQTAAEVRAFIDGLPSDYPTRLRWVLLSSADPLFRAGQTQKRN